MSNHKLRITVLVSGSGTNLAALIKACSDGTIANAEIVRVISNRKAAYGLERAKNASIPTEYHNLVPYKKRYPENVDRARSEYDKDLATKVLDDNPSLLVCAGWMHVLSPSFLDPVAQAQVQVINLHPALPGQYDGTEAVSRAHNAWLQGRITQTGVMIHKVIAEVDQGTPIIVEEIPFVKGEDEDVERFEQKLHSVEWRLIVQATAIVLSEIEKRKSDKTTGGCD